MTVGYIFDLDETLVTYDPDVDGIFRNACERVGVEPTADAREAIGPGYVETFREFEESPYLGAARAAREAGLSIEPAQFAEQYVEAELAASHVHEDTRRLLAELSPVGVLTNGYGPIQRRKLAETGLDAYVDVLVTPDDVEAFKPDDAPFDAVTAGLDATEYVMVGDSIEYDIRPANERGYRTVLVGGDAESGDEPVIAPDDRIDGPSALGTLRERLREFDGE